MESQEFIVLYTHQKMKKAKVWQDGTLKLGPAGSKAILYDDKGACLESLFLKCLEVKPGDDLESDRYLITVEEVKVAGSLAAKQEVVREAPPWSSRSFAGRFRGCQPPGLKRKYTGFQGPRQVPKKMVVTENGDWPASFEAGATLFSPSCSSLPLFPTVGRKEMSNMQTVPHSAIAAQAGASQGPCPSTSLEPSPRVPWEAGTSLGSGRRCEDAVLATEPSRRHSPASHCPGAPQQHVRSQAQILALLKSTPTTIPELRDAEPVGHPGQLWTPAVCGAGLEGHTEALGAERPHSPRQLETAAASRSRWAVYLSPQDSEAASASGAGGGERQAAEQENDACLNLEDLLEQKRMQAFGTHAEIGKKHREDELGDRSASWHQAPKKEPLLGGSALVCCSSAGQGGLLAETTVGGNDKVPFSGQDQGCMGGPPGQDLHCAAQSPTASGCQVSSLSQDSNTLDDDVEPVSENGTANERQGGVLGSGGNGTQPFLEVTFNLSNFETSDSEEESQESSGLSQGAGTWAKGSSYVQKPHEGLGCQEISSERLPCLPSVGHGWTEKCSVKETLSQFCDKTCIGIDPGPCEDGNAGEEDDSDLASSSSPSVAGCAGESVEDVEDTDRSCQTITRPSDFASLSNKSKGTGADLHTPDLLDIATNQASKNNDLLSHQQPWPFVLGSVLDNDAKQVSSPISGHDSSVRTFDGLRGQSKHAALGESHSQACSSLLALWEAKQPLYQDTEVCIPECDDSRSSRVPRDCGHIEVEPARNSSSSWSNPGDSLELSGVVSHISPLKSLSAHSTALEIVEMLPRQDAAFTPPGTLQAEEPESQAEARKPCIRIPFIPHLKQGSQQILEDNEVEPSNPLQTPQVSSHCVTQATSNSKHSNPASSAS